ncbi:MAG: hypothetical protein RMK64_08645 [Rhodovarius sp.]|nr:CpaD family pilus assembly protein [Rhodovarius sp.]MCX7931952.1 CpaD family pilus assembly protein [Rhodovarius sp.]MDW8315022.1 hypothetical protein [Rhodovarius sp.]
MRQRLPLLFLLGLLAAGCAYDPYDLPGTWRASGVNQANLARMVADPAHLSRGIGTDRERAANAVRPIELLDSGERQALPTTRATNIGFVGGVN